MSEEKSEENDEKLKTVPQDPRFPSINVANWCFSTFVDYHKCVRLMGEGNECCEHFAKIYKAICPNDWISRWENQLAVGTFPVDLPSETNDCKKNH